MELSSEKSHRKTSELSTFSRPETSPPTRLVLLQLLPLPLGLQGSTSQLLGTSDILLGLSRQCPLELMCSCWSQRRAVNICGLSDMHGIAKFWKVESVPLELLPATQHSIQESNTHSLTKHQADKCRSWYAVNIRVQTNGVKGGISIKGLLISTCPR